MLASPWAAPKRMVCEAVKEKEKLQWRLQEIKMSRNMKPLPKIGAASPRQGP